MTVHRIASQITNAVKSFKKTTAIPFSHRNKAILDILYKEGFISSFQMGDDQGPFLTPIPITPDNINDRRLWVHLKYKHGESALNEMKIVSKPSRRVFASLEECKALACAKRVNSLIKKQLLGQVTIVQTEQFGILKLQEALQKQVGGEVLCIAY